jgi:hypothetical protein
VRFVLHSGNAKERSELWPVRNKLAGPAGISQSKSHRQGRDHFGWLDKLPVVPLAPRESIRTSRAALCDGGPKRRSRPHHRWPELTWPFLTKLAKYFFRLIQIDKTLFFIFLEKTQVLAFLFVDRVHCLFIEPLSAVEDCRVFTDGVVNLLNAVVQLLAQTEISVKSSRLVFLNVEPELDSLRSNPRFLALQQRLHFPQ